MLCFLFLLPSHRLLCASPKIEQLRTTSTANRGMWCVLERHRHGSEFFSYLRNSVLIFHLYSFSPLFLKDGLEKEHHSAFTILLGITLSDCLEDYGGNFTVFPGTHRVNTEDLRAIVQSGQQPSQLVKENKRSFDNAVQVKARRGDIVIAHHKLAHKGGDNCSPHIRYQIYFRLNHVVCFFAGN